ncbi:NAD(P)-dependent oxidoreductase [Naumannella sp. ID2617S]|uniref:NAD-dependent epimerase/dehydratase domain-containing protein n=1 Tax=Enemella dayhoffiae TaxID=2016507 RepID=A0A255H9M0_9ACTN|nr:NAD(P)-dependent oxidoreductase [Enemella dayhoffiae]NNG19117.1 NAD(P)-dependent oxidoreductase [Naumannella sp. ID2617S]OYO24279.1 hypothetical protein CGZ93_04025 [Enemella dayhoffiae]
MRVWVSGTSGKLGGEVARQLREQGHEVSEADIRSPHPVNLLDDAAVANSLKGCEAIIHCAGIPSPEGQQPAHLVHSNVMSTFNALEAAWRAGIRTAVLASSGSIYGTAWAPEPLQHAYLPVDEDAPLRYRDPYALTKDVLERTGAMYARRGMTVTALRFHWILTVDEVRRLAERPADGGEAKNLWGYVELSDAARACLLALTPNPGPNRFQPLLIAAADTRVHEPIEELLDRYCPEVERRRPLTGSQGAFDCSRAAEVIGWRAETTWR